MDNITTHIFNKLDRMEDKIDDIKEKMMTKEDCKDAQKTCIRTKKIEWSNKKLIALFSGGAGLLAVVFKALS